jgi:hypothetical protein
MNYGNRFIVLVCCAVSIYCVVPLFCRSRAVLGANDASRWDTVWSLTHGKHYIIDEAPYVTIDKVFNNGHFYSSKPALLPAVLAVLATMVSGITHATLPDQDKTLIPIILVLINVLPFSLALYCFGKWLERQPFSGFTKGFCLLTAAFGTYLTAYSTSLNNHTVVAIAVLFGLITGSRIATARSPSAFDFFACGVLSAWILANELTAECLFILAFIYLWKIDRVKTVKFFVPGALLVTVLFFGCTLWATGGLVPFYLHRSLYHYPGSYWDSPQGMHGANDSMLVYVLNFAVGHHGIISLTPVLLFGLIGVFSRQTPSPLRFGAILLTLANCAFVWFFTKDYGGACQGPRWFIWLIPLWLFCMPPAVERLGRSSLGKIVLIESFLWSFFSVCYATFAWPEGPWSPSWLLEWMRSWNLTKF